MALLNPVDQIVVSAPRSAVRLNWRLLAALGATAAFWIVVGEGVARIVHG
ncbi:hypothetical protein ABI118_15615 [Enterococcus faecium]